MPARAPHSMDILQIVMRPSIDIFSMASPRYSTIWPCPPPVPVLEMRARMRSLGVTPSGNSPSTVTAIVLGRACDRV